MQRLTAVFLALLLAACASSSQQGPPIALQLDLVNSPTNILYFAGPVSLQFALSVSNPTDDPVTLRRLDLRTVGGFSFYMRTSTTPFNVQIKPHATTTVTMSAWGTSRGGYLAADEPIQLQATAYFESPKGPFLKMTNQRVSPRE